MVEQYAAFLQRPQRWRLSGEAEVEVLEQFWHWGGESEEVGLGDIVWWWWVVVV